MKFVVGERYYSADKHQMVVYNRFDSKSLIRVAVGFAFPANYKIHTGRNGREWITAKGHIFTAC